MVRRIRRWHIFHALKNRNFRLFFWGQFSSMIGTWIQIVAVSWLVYRLTDSVFWLGFTAFAMNFPALFFSPFAGILADRFDRRTLLLWVNGLAMGQAVILAALVLFKVVHVWEVIGLSILLGIFNAFELPIRQAFLSEMVDDKKDLPNAIALNSSIFNASRLVGPAVAGFLIAALGEGICFVVNALSFIPVIISLKMMRLPLRSAESQDQDVLRQFTEGVRYAMGFLPIRALLLIVGVLSFLSGVIYALLPVFAKEVFLGGPKTLGFLLSASGVGALSGAVMLAGRRTVIGLGRHVAVSVMLAGCSMMLFSIFEEMPWASGAMLLNGLGMILGIGGSNIILQSVVDEDKRGRVMSLYGFCLVGPSPIGSILAGTIALHIGAEATMVWAGALTLVAGAAFWGMLPSFRAHIRPVYARKGVIPQA